MKLYAVIGILAIGALAGCSASESPQNTATPSGDPLPDTTVTVLVHDSFWLPDELIATFESEYGVPVEFVPVGDAGALTNHVVLTAGSPTADAVYGIDNTFASRAISAGALADYSARTPTSTDPIGNALTAIDFSDVCFNVDLAAFDGDAPESFDDLLDPQYAGLISAPNPATSSPGLALLLATYATYGDGWSDYWTALRDQDLKVTASWSDSYFVDFSAPNYGGDYPIVLSYASSPPAELIDGAPTTRALLDTCFRQTEYAGVLAGSDNEVGAQSAIEWLLSDAVQSALPEAMYVYPVSTTASIPDTWLEYAPLSENPVMLEPQTIDAEREALLREWTAIMIDGQ